MNHAGELAVSEIFGPTVQGEGPSMGRRCAFVRLGHCNLRCRWCDTPFTWDWSGLTGTRYDPRRELRWMTPADVAARVVALDVGMLVVSGGEPLLQQGALAGLWDALSPSLRVEVETNGTRAPERSTAARVDAFNVSPKLSHNGDPLSRRWVPHAIRALRDTGRANWKFVAAKPSDLDEIAEWVDAFDLSPVYVMPLGVTSENVNDRLAVLADAVIARGWNLTTRLHVNIWGGKRGV